MKKIISIILVLVLCTIVIASCDSASPPVIRELSDDEFVARESKSTTKSIEKLPSNKITEEDIKEKNDGNTEEHNEVNKEENTESEKKGIVSEASVYKNQYLKLGDEKQVEVYIKTSTTTDYSANIIISNKEIVSATYFNESEPYIKIKGLADGETTITVQFIGGVECSFNVTVIDVNSVEILYEESFPISADTIVTNPTYWYYTKGLITGVTETRELGFSGDIHITLTFSVKKTYDCEGNSNKEGCSFKLYRENSQGTPVDSRNMFTKDIVVGQTIEISYNFYCAPDSTWKIVIFPYYLET